ncbi:MAG: prolyl oligopeptidase family serine peptidase [Luteitalea sp.]|nr:prolyl oligopeptidase family serine peptidase [Luteitalea sp.]
MRRSIVVVLVACLVPVLVSGQSRRPLTPDDLFELEALGDVAISPDGEWLAYVLKRRKAEARHHKLDFLDGNDRGDVWLVSTRNGSPRNLTDGAVDGSGYWAPVWSPDGQRLAMLSTKGNNVFLWVWERASGRLSQMTDRAVDGASCEWTSNHEIVCPVLPAGEKPTRMTVEVQAAETAMTEWPKAWAGREATASVIESGVPASFDKRPQGDLLVIDCLDPPLDPDTVASSSLVTGFFRELQVSPDRAHVAFLKQVDIIQPDPARLLTHAIEGRYQVGVVSVETDTLHPGLDRVARAYPGSFRWSPDASALAIVGHEDRSPDAPAAVFRYRIASESLERLTGNDLEVVAPSGYMGPSATLQWTATNHLLVFAKPKEQTSSGSGEATDASLEPTSRSEKDSTKSRRDWYLVESPGRQRNLTSEVKTPPTELLAEAGGRTFVGLAEGDILRIRASVGPVTNLTDQFEPKISAIVWPSGSGAASREVSQLIVLARRDPDKNDKKGDAGRTSAPLEPDTLYRLDLRSNRITAMKVPSPEATLAGFDPDHDVAAMTAVDRTGTYLWTSRASLTETTPIVETNVRLREVAEGEVRQIAYRSLDGQDLKAWILLPPGYTDTERYPLVTWVYAGSMAGDKPSSLARINNGLGLNLQLLAAHGYAVLLPSMPLEPEGSPSDPYMELTKGVLPAVDKAIELGIADPDKLGVMGQSFGGFSTYGLITQTRRFKAAVSLAGLSDLAALYGQFDVRFRYEQYPHEPLFRMSLAESGQTRMGNPPWKDLGRYVRNSPLTYVDRVTTPLMIIQGDMDYVAIQQGEQIFTALYRQNKRGTFVRYWGEGHVVESPANIRDMWQRIYAWFDQFFVNDE